MNITKDTTEAEIYKPVEAARERLVKGATNALNDSVTVADYLNDLARAQGEAYARYNYLSMLKGALEVTGFSEEDAVKNAKEGAMALLFNSPSDTWSGRTNDVRRAYQDGVRAAVAVLVRGY